MVPLRQVLALVEVVVQGALHHLVMAEVEVVLGGQNSRASAEGEAAGEDQNSSALAEAGVEVVRELRWVVEVEEVWERSLEVVAEGLREHGLLAVEEEEAVMHDFEMAVDEEAAVVM